MTTGARSRAAAVWLRAAANKAAEIDLIKPRISSRLIAFAVGAPHLPVSAPSDEVAVCA
jgi:hypothetical protein